MMARSLKSEWNGVKTQDSEPRNFVFRVLRLVSCVSFMVLFGISTAVYPQEDSALKVVPKEILACLRVTNPQDLSGKIINFINSLNLPDVPSIAIDQLIYKMTGSEMKSLMDLEDWGFSTRSDACVFWTTPKYLSIAVHVSSREKMEAHIREEIEAAEEVTDKEYKGITYTLLKEPPSGRPPPSCVLLEDIFVLSLHEDAIMTVIETHLKEKPSILQDEKYLANTEILRAGDLTGYVALDQIVSTYLPALQLRAEKAKEDLSKQMEQQKAQLPTMDFDVTKILGAEMDMGIWILQQIRSYAISLGVGMDGIWINDSLKFKSDSPVCKFLNISPRRLELVRYLPGDVIMAGGMTMDAASFEKLNSVMLDALIPILQEKMSLEVIAELRRKYETAIHDILSCLGDEIVFAVPTKSDRMMPRLIYIFEVADEDKARGTIGDLDYILEVSKPFYEAFGMDFPMTRGPAQKYTGIQIESFQIDLSRMAGIAPNAATMYPEKEFLWYAFVDDKMIYTMSQSSDTIKDSIDAIKGRKSSIVNLPNFEDIDIRLPEKSNMVTYISPTGYLRFVMSMMMSQVSQSMPAGEMADTIEPDVGFAVATNLDGDSIRNFAYFLVEEIQQLVDLGLNISQRVEGR